MQVLWHGLDVLIRPTLSRSWTVGLGLLCPSLTPLFPLLSLSSPSLMRWSWQLLFVINAEVLGKTRANSGCKTLMSIGCGRCRYLKVPMMARDVI
uniref:ARAD1A09174p n=1 Tax=Blastobotrys adeninivorans TaxID=409370 RepID=A0A060SXG2_BLAAD